jgi:O-antigen/teichoic acid export membrane protein
VTLTAETLSSMRSLARGILWNSFGRCLPIIVAMLATPFLLHGLGVERWALFTLALSVAGSFGILDFGVSAALTRALAERIGTPGESDAAPLVVAALVMLTLVGCGGAALGVVLTPPVVDHLLKVPPNLRTEAITAFRLLAVSAPLIIINSAFWGVLSAYQRWGTATLLNTPVTAMYYLGPVLALLVQNSLVWVVATLVAARLMQALVYGGLTLRLLPGLTSRWHVELRLLRPLLRIGAWVTVTNTLWPVMLFLDRFIIGSLLSLAALSYFSTSVDLVLRLGIMPIAIAAAVFPAVATSHRTMPDRVQRMLRTGSLAVVVVLFPACMLMAGLSDELLTFWLGSAFAANSATVLPILSIGMFLKSIAVLPGTLTDAIGRPEAGAMIMLVMVVLFLPVIMLMSARYGLIGVALAWTLRSAFFCSARLLVCGRLNASVTPVISKVFAVAFVGTVALTVCPLISPLSARLTIMGFATILVVLMAGTTLLNRDELVQLWQTIQKYLANPSLTRTTRHT